jgi:glycosyltransferase involved in cell wall biosynthesis
MGEAARLAVRTIEAAEIPVATYAITRLASRQRHPFRRDEREVYDYDVNLVCVNADQVGEFVGLVGPDFFDGRYNIGQWSWELDEFPEQWASATAPFNEIWAVSEFTRRAIVTQSDVPVFAVPHPIVAPEVPDGIDRAAFGLPGDRFVFLFCFDLLSVIERKNPIGVIEAFRRAFGSPGEWKGRGPAPLLVIKVINAEREIVGLERLRLAAEDPDVLLLEGYMDRGHVIGLMNAADCYVSLHRSEGFGLTMAESMALGKPVIATAYSGNLDFMDNTTAYLVPWTPMQVGPGNDPYSPTATWADPDVDAAARMMRWVVDHPDEARATGERARVSVLQHHSPAARAAFVRERMAAIQVLRGGGSVGGATNGADAGGRVRKSGPWGDGAKGDGVPGPNGDAASRRFGWRRDRARRG